MSAHLEREAKLAAPPGFQLPALGGAGIATGPPEERRLDTVYWDTDDHRLLRWGSTLRHRAGESWTVKLREPANGRFLSRTEHTFAGPPRTPPDEALDLVRAYVRGAEVRPVARMRTRRRVMPLLGDDGRRVGEIDDDEVTAYVDRRVVARFREIEVELAEDAAPSVLAAVVERLRAEGAGEPDATPKLVRVLGELDRLGPDVVVPELTEPIVAGEVVRRAVAGSVVRLLSHDPGVRLGGDPEDVHQARVATRRLRSDLRTFAPLLDAAWADGLREELRWLAGELGAVRDAEVLLERVRDGVARLPEPDRQAGGRVAALFERDVAEARTRLIAALREPGYVALLDRLVAAAREPVLSDRAAAPAEDVLPGLVAGPWSKLRRDAWRLGDGASDEDLHALRIRAKRARYAAEAAAPALGGKVAAFAKAVAGLQEVLGTHHDAVVTADRLRERAGRGRQAFAAGQLWGLEQAVARQARAGWRDAWRAASRKKLRSWM
jgi:CHAD domain-containing protein